MNRRRNPPPNPTTPVPAPDPDPLDGGAGPDVPDVDEPDISTIDLMSLIESGEPLTSGIPAPDPKPDLYLDEVLAEDEIEAARRRADFDHRTTVIVHALDGLTRSEIHTVIERAGAVARERATR